MKKEFKLYLTLLTFPHLAMASSPLSGESALVWFMAYGFFGSIIIYTITSLILMMFDKLQALYTVPFFLVAIGTAALTFIEILLSNFVQFTIPVGGIIGSGLATWLYFSLVKPKSSDTK